MKLICPNCRPGRGTCAGGSHRHRLRPQTSDNSAEKDEQERHPARLALPGGRQQAQGEGRRRRRRRLREGAQGREVEVEYIPVDTRAQRIKAAFNDPKSAPDVIEYGNTDTAGYVKDGGLADVSAEFGGLGRGAGHRPDRPAVGHGRRQDLRRAVLRRRPRPVLPHRRLQGAGHRSRPRPMAELIADRARRSTRRSPSCTGSRSAARTPTARCRSSGRNGGELADGSGGAYTAAIDSAAAQKGIKAYTSSSATTTARPRSAPAWAATTPSPPSPRARPAWRSAATSATRPWRREGQGQVRGRAAARRRGGLDRAGVRGRQQHRRAEEQFAPHARGRPHEAARRQEDAARRCSTRWASCRRSRTCATRSRRRSRSSSRSSRPSAPGTKFVPASPALGPDRRLAGPADDVPGDRQRQEGRRRAASDEAAKKMDAAFADAG